MGQLRPLKQKVNVMRSVAIVLMLSAFSGVALAQFKCENHTLPDGTTCPVDDNTDHTYPDEDHCSRYWDCYNGCFTHMQCQLIICTTSPPDGATSRKKCTAVIGIVTAVRVRTILLCLATLIVKQMEVTDFTPIRIIASNTSNAQP